MYLTIFNTFLVVQLILAIPVDENRPHLQKRQLDGDLFSLADLISNVENSLIRTAHSAGLKSGINKLRSERHVEPDNLQNTKTQLSILTLKLNPQSPVQTVKDKPNTDSEKRNNLNIQNESHSEEKKDVGKSILNLKTEIVKNATETQEEKNKTSLNEVKNQNEKEKSIVKTVAEIEVTPIILASRP